MNLQTLPAKSVFRIDEVSSLTGVKTFNIRYWETKFPKLNPLVSSSGQKLFDHEDVELIMQIKKLHLDEGMRLEDVAFELEKVKEDAFVPPPIPDNSRNTEYIDPHMTLKHLSDRELQKLVLAKAKLSSILQICEGTLAAKQWDERRYH